MGTAADAHRLRRRPSGRHRMGRGRHVADRAAWPLAAAIRDVAVVLAASSVIAAATAVALPRATSSASMGHPAAPPATSLVRSADRSFSPTAVCPIHWRRSAWHVKRLIKCAAGYFGVSRDQALYVAWRESRFDPNAYNATGRAAGIFQHLLRYWPERAARYGFPNASPYNARANIFVTMRMVRRVGWWPWSL